MKSLEKKLFKQNKSCWEQWNKNTKKKAFDFAEKYKLFLNNAKTEREVVQEGVKMAKANGFIDIKKLKSLKPGSKVYAVNRERSLFLARLGKDKLQSGVNLIMAHVDSPHLDFKVSPLYEDENIAFFKTHYYGGIKKYQWPTIALALHGTVYFKNGKKRNIVIGEDVSDPIFMITDLLPHLDREGGPGTKIRGRDVKGEDLNLVVASMPIKDKKIKEKVKLFVLNYLYEKYGIKEEDLTSADLEAVPSEKARDLGFDRSMISAYGHDDRICAYASLKSLFDAKQFFKTQICIWIDREEIGSDGNTGAKSIFLEVFISDLLKLSGKEGSLDEVYRVFSSSQGISADVTAAVDPDYKDVHDLRNACRLGYGLAIEKYTGSGGKYSTSEASGEFLAKLRNIFSSNKDIIYQISGGLGKVDQGGGGTIAKYMANRNIEVIDAGVALLNMHAPLEIASKSDLYAAYLAYKEFFINA